MASSRVVILPDQNVTFQDFHSTRSFPSCSASCLLVPPCKCHTFLLSQAYPNPKYTGEKLQPEPHRSHYGLRETSGEQELKGLGLYQWRAHKLTHTHKLTQSGSVLLSGITFFLKGCSLLGSTAILKLLFEDDGCCQ